MKEKELKMKKYLDSIWYDIRVSNVFKKEHNGNVFYSLNLNERYNISVNAIYKVKGFTDRVAVRFITEKMMKSGRNTGMIRTYNLWDRTIAESVEIQATDLKEKLDNLENSNLIKRENTFSDSDRLDYLFK